MFLIFFVLVLRLPLPQAVAETFLASKINNFFPGCSVELDEARFFLLKGLEARSINIIRDKQIISSFRDFKASYPAFFLLSQKGKLRITSGTLDIGMLTEKVEFLKFLSKILNDPQLKNRLVFDSFFLESDLNGGKIVIENFNLQGKELKVVSAGSFEKQKNADFVIDVFLSDRLTEGMSGGTKEIFLEAQEDGFSKISFNIRGSFSKPSFKIKTNFLELDIS